MSINSIRLHFWVKVSNRDDCVQVLWLNFQCFFFFFFFWLLQTINLYSANYVFGFLLRTLFFGSDTKSFFFSFNLKQNIILSITKMSFCQRNTTFKMYYKVRSVRGKMERDSWTFFTMRCHFILSVRCIMNRLLQKKCEKYAASFVFLLLLLRLLLLLSVRW